MGIIGNTDRLERIAELRPYYKSPDPVNKIIGNVSPVRARIATEAYKEFGLEDKHILRAKTLAKVLDEIPIYILPGDLILGSTVSAPHAIEFFPEFGVDWFFNEIDKFETRESDRCHVEESDKKELLDIARWWKGRSVNDRIQELLGPEEYSYAPRGLVFMCTPSQYTGANAWSVNWTETLFKYGVNGYIAQIEEKLANLRLSEFEDIEKKPFYEACLISLRAVLSFAKRYVDLAREMAEKEENPNRKQELLRMAANCERVPAEPPRDFWEALQAVNIIHCCFCLDTASFTFMPGRIDQFWYPYFKKDIDEGNLTMDEAQALMECQLLKYNTSKVLWDDLSSIYYAGNPAIHVVTIGGVTRDGKDASNELSYMILDCYKHLRMMQPEIACVLHKDTPDEFLRAACELIRLGISHPKLGFLEQMKATRSNDPYDYSEEDLNDLAWNGCGENVIPSKDRNGPDWGYSTGPMVSLDLALNDGVLRVTGDQLGPHTGDPRKFKTYEDVVEAWKIQQAFSIDKTCMFRSATQIAHQELVPTPLQSVFNFGCIEKGLDRMRGGCMYNASSGSRFGVPTCADALAALKKVVFEEGKYTLSEVIDALDANWEGYEAMRQDMLAAPKYGNDDDYVDLIARKIGQFLGEQFHTHSEIHGGFQRDTFVAVTGGVAVGREVGASPDGRFAGEPLNEGGASPQQGRDHSGPTAAMKSVCKLDYSTCGGSVCNIRFSPEAVAGEEGIKNLMAFLRAYEKMGGYHLQFNVVSNETLKDAQAHPEKYPDLMVRVAAYSAYFVEISEALQNDIISRTEHGAF